MILSKQPALSRLRHRQELLGFEAKKSLGQNFLVRDSVIEKIIKSIETPLAPCLIEIGPGLGALTDFLLELDKDLTLIELDSRFANYWKEQKGCHLLQGDALQLNWTQFEKAYILVSNLPYQISSSLVVERSIDSSGYCRQMVLMFQKEVAQRLRAPSLHSHYGFLSVLAQTFWVMRTVCDAGPKDFDPPPKIASRVLSFKPSSQYEEVIKSRPQYLKFLKGSFLHPRKMMVSNWQESLGLSKQVSWDFLKQLNLKETVRPHEVSVDEFVSLYQLVTKD
jgi:16S rRNA (adenine1518-N6/adenine1519-N6)-dimethyltransferase